jgi:hypothetical protein
MLDGFEVCRAGEVDCAVGWNGWWSHIVSLANDPATSTSTGWADCLSVLGVEFDSGTDDMEEI